MEKMAIKIGQFSFKVPAYFDNGHFVHYPGGKMDIMDIKSPLVHYPVKKWGTVLKCIPGVELLKHVT